MANQMISEEKRHLHQGKGSMFVYNNKKLIDIYIGGETSDPHWGNCQEVEGKIWWSSESNQHLPPPWKRQNWRNWGQEYSRCWKLSTCLVPSCLTTPVEWQTVMMVPIFKKMKWKGFSSYVGSHFSTSLGKLISGCWKGSKRNHVASVLAMEQWTWPLPFWSCWTSHVASVSSLCSFVDLENAVTEMHGQIIKRFFSSASWSTA